MNRKLLGQPQAPPKTQIKIQSKGGGRDRLQQTLRIRNTGIKCYSMAPFSSLMQVKRLSRQLITPAPSTQEVVDDGGVLLAGGEGGGVHHGWRGAHHHRVVRHVVHLGVDVLLFVTRSKIGENS